MITEASGRETLARGAAAVKRAPLLYTDCAHACRASATARSQRRANSAARAPAPRAFGPQRLPLTKNAAAARPTSRRARTATMPLESTIICLDTSEFMRNGDFTPTRHESQQDAANLVVGAKMQQNPESSVGVLTMASTGRGAGARVLVSPTDDMGNILNSLHNASVGGQLNFVEGVQVAQLAPETQKEQERRAAHRVVCRESGRGRAESTGQSGKTPQEE